MGRRPSVVGKTVTFPVMLSNKIAQMVSLRRTKRAARAVDKKYFK